MTAVAVNLFIIANLLLDARGQTEGDIRVSGTNISVFDPVPFTVALIPPLYLYRDTVA